MKRRITNGLRLRQVRIELMDILSLFVSEVPIEPFYKLSREELHQLDHKFSIIYNRLINFIRILDDFQISKVYLLIHQIRSKFHKLFLDISRAEKIKNGTYLQNKKEHPNERIRSSIDRLKTERYILD